MLSRPMSRLVKTAVDLRFRFQALPLLALKCCWARLAKIGEGMLQALCFGILLL